MLDEPTNNLDSQTKTLLENILIEAKKTVIFASHDRQFMNNIADSVLEIHEQKIELFSGNYDNFKQTKSLIKAHEKDKYDKQQISKKKLEHQVRELKSSVRINDSKKYDKHIHESRSAFHAKREKVQNTLGGIISSTNTKIGALSKLEKPIQAKNYKLSFNKKNIPDGIKLLEFKKICKKYDKNMTKIFLKILI